MKSREFTTDEVREKFMEHVRMLIEYWDKSDRATSKEKIEGFAHSLFATIDGESVDLPSFILAPTPHKDDKKYNIDHQQNYYGENNNINCDIAGNLHNLLYKKVGNISNYADLEQEFKVTEQLLKERQRILDAIPECIVHGGNCVPNALEWIEKMKHENR